MSFISYIGFFRNRPCGFDANIQEVLFRLPVMFAKKIQEDDANDNGDGYN